MARAHGHDRHDGTARRKARIKVALEAVDDRMHVAHGAITEKRHRAVRDATVRFDLGPPNPAVTDANPIDIEGLRDDDVIDARRREPTALGQIGNAAETA